MKGVKYHFERESIFHLQLNQIGIPSEAIESQTNNRIQFPSKHTFLINSTGNSINKQKVDFQEKIKTIPILSNLI